MKKLIIAMLAVSVALFSLSCQKDDDMNSSSQEEMLMEQIANADDISVLGVGDMPSAITGYVQQNHAPFEMEMAFYAPQLGYEVMMENGLCLFFGMNGNPLNHDGMNNSMGNHDGMNDNMGNHQGGMNHVGFNPWMTGDVLDAADLPQAALDYISSNYSGNTVVTVVLKPSGKLVVELSGGTVLMFNPDGSFIQVWSGQGGGNQGHFGGMNGNHMGMGSSGNHGGMGGMGQGNHGGMMSHQGGMGNHQGSNGTCWGGTAMSVDNLPVAITDYVTANHPDATIVHAMQTYGGKYFLRLSDGAKLVFDENGNILFDSGN